VSRAGAPLIERWLPHSRNSPDDQEDDYREEHELYAKPENQEPQGPHRRLDADALVFQFVVLFTGRYPEGGHSFVSGYMRLELRAAAWLYGLTDRYPGFNIQP
jgi:hypothetical protein